MHFVFLLFIHFVAVVSEINLFACLQDLGIQSKPQQIGNCDETSFFHDQSQTKVVVSKGEKSSRLTAATGHYNTLVLACVNAAGEKLPLICDF